MKEVVAKAVARVAVKAAEREKEAAREKEVVREKEVGMKVLRYP